MTSPVLPVLPGLTFPVTRTPMFKTSISEAVSGKETRIAYWSQPRWRWETSYSVLRSTASQLEFQKLAGFFGQLRGSFGSFLYTDPDDFSVTTQAIGTGNGVKTSFQLQRTFGAGGFTMTQDVLAPNTGAAKTAFVNATPTAATWNDFDTATPGTLVFAVAPANGTAITATFQFYFPCRFEDDDMNFELFMSAFYANEKVAFKSIK